MAWYKNLRGNQRREFWEQRKQNTIVDQLNKLHSVGFNDDDIRAAGKNAWGVLRSEYYDRKYNGYLPPQTPQGGVPTTAPTTAAPMYSEEMRDRGYATQPQLQPTVVAPQLTSPDGKIEYDASGGLLIKRTRTATANPNAPMNLTGATVQDALNGTANWSEVDVNQRRTLLSNPQFYETGQINKYPKWMQQQILADSNFKWENLPIWQKWYYQVSSSPAGMGAAQGALMGLGGGPAGSAVGGALGAGLGWAAMKSGYDPTKEAWQQDGVAAGAFGWMNFLAEKAEQVAGMGVQSIGAAVDPNVDLKDVWTKEGWEAGAVTFETLAPAIAATWGDGKFTARDLLKIAPPIYVATALTDLMLNPDKYKGFEKILGAKDPLALEQSFQDRINEARERIKNGENYRVVAQDFQTGIMGQMGDMAGQAFIDPLNVLPSAEVKVAGKVAEVTGNKVAAEAFKQSNAPIEAAQKYRNLVQTGLAQTIDPNFRVDTMGAFSRMVAGINEKGQIKAGAFTQQGILDTPKKKTGWIENMTSLTPASRAQIGASMFYENIGALLSRFEDPSDAGMYLRALANSDMVTWKELGSQFAESPEFYTVLPALKAYNSEGLGGILQAWDMTAPNRDALTKVADVLGEQPGKLLDDLAKNGTAEQDFQRIQQRLQESNNPQARALLDEIQAGRFTVDTLKQIVDVFTGDGALAWHPNQVKAQMLDNLGSHFDEWVTKRLMLDQEPEAKSALFRTAALMKQAQSILLLGGSPGYALQNGMSNMVHRAATGIYGYLTPNQINGWMDRFGVNPARMDEGVGIGGMVEQATGSGAVKTDAISKATQGSGALTTAKRHIGKISKAMPFSKLSAWFEKTESRQAFAIAMRQMWSQTWRRGVGFKTMDPQLVKVIQGMGIEPSRIYAAIEAGMNQVEIEKALYGRQEGIQARSLVDDAAKATGVPATKAADILEKIGILDTLDKHLKGKTTRDGVVAAFKRAEKVAQDWLDMQTGEDLKAIAEHARQKVGLEGAVSGLDVVQQANAKYFDAWMDHYHRFGEIMQDLGTMEDPVAKGKAIELAYELSDSEFRRINARTAANYKGIFDVWGMKNNPDANAVLSAIGQSDMAMKLAYDEMRKLRRAYFDGIGTMDTLERASKWSQVEAQTNAAFNHGFDAKAKAEKQMGAALGNIYEKQYGPAAGEAARKWWEDVVKFNQDIVKRERNARAEFAQLPKEQREAAKAKYYQEEKTMLIAEAQKINEEGIARLERVIKKGGGSGSSTQPTTPTQPPSDIPSTIGKGKNKRKLAAEEINTLVAAAEQRKAAEAADVQNRVESVWNVAEQFAREGLPYSRNVLQDKFALLGALRKEEYGGFPDLKGIQDERVTPEFVRSVMEKREQARVAQVERTVGDAIALAQDAAQTVHIPKIDDNTNILKAIKEHGGLRLDLIQDITGDRRPKTAPGLFTRQGIGIDEMAQMLADDGYPIDMTHPSDPGGIKQATMLINRARGGDNVFPMGHDHDAMIQRAEYAAAERAFMDAIDAAQPEPFSIDTWRDQFEVAAVTGDLTRMYELAGEMPEEFHAQQTPDGETWADYQSRTIDETVERVTQDEQDTQVAEAMVRAEEAIAQGEDRAEAASTRNLLKEKFTEAFGLTEEQANAYMEMSDALTGWYERVTGESGDIFYSRYYSDVVRVGDEVDSDLHQIQPINRQMSRQEYSDYARALVRAGQDELRRAVQGERTKADRVTLLNEAHKLNARMAEEVARRTADILFQDGKFEAVAKGGVSFDADGIRATIHAFEAADFSTLVHENAHVFRRVLNDVAGRTDNTTIKADLSAIEEWAGVKDGKWNREAEEKFARGFERYITEGKAPTPKLVRAFETFKNWMLEIYRTITGSAIDVKLTDEVRQVFDRMLGDEKTKKKQTIAEVMRSGDNRLPAFQQLRDVWGALDSGSQNEALSWILNKTMTDPLSGLETLVAKSISEKPAGWVDATSDLNALTAINNTWGHGAGDQIITGIGRIAKVEIQKVGGRAFRVGGDEMSYWFPDEATAKRALSAIDEKLQQEVFNVGGEDRQGFTVSYGIGDTAADADTSLYQDKSRRVGLGQRSEVRDQMPDSVKVAQKVAEIRQARTGDNLFQRAEPVDTLQFRNWFSDSKVVDEQGKPLVVYHGTAEDFQVFKKARKNNKKAYDKDSYVGLFFSPDPDQANFFAGIKGKEKAPVFGEPQGSNVMPVYLSMQNPKIVDWEGRVKGEDHVISFAEVAKKAGNDGLIIKNVYDAPIGKSTDIYIAFENTQVKSTANRGTFDPNDPNILFQDADQPIGALDQASQFLPQSEPMDQGWGRYVKPLLSAMQDGAVKQLNERPLDGATRDMSPEGQAMLQRYMKQTQNDMATAKLATVRWGEQKRDFAMLNYNKRYGFDRWMDIVLPYQFYQTRSAMTWAMRALDKPSWYSNYARLKMQQNRYERDIPERLRGKIQIPAPWLPEWMGDSLYIDPISNLFFPAGLINKAEQKQKDANYQQIEAERVLQEWAADGRYTDAQIAEAAQNQEGALWERAFAEAQIRRESEIANPIDFFTSFFGPAWYLSTPLNLAGIKVPGISKGDPNKVSNLPLTNTARAIDTVTQGTWAEPVGDIVGLLGKPEEWARKKAGLPTMGEYGEYYTKRQVANMVAEGLITSEQANMAMIEKQGQIWEQATQRVQMELAMRVPTMGALYAGLHEGPKGFAQAALPSLFGSGLLPAGELEYRGLKEEWNQAWKQFDAGDKTAVTRFFENYPEYEAYLAKGKSDEELFKSFMIGQIWDGYMALGVTNQKQARAEMGEIFQQAFLDKETRSYESIDTETLTQWAQMLKKQIPQAINGQPYNPPTPEPLNLYNEDVTQVTDEFFRQRAKNYGNYYELEQGYYGKAPSERVQYLSAHPELQAYWNFKKKWMKAYPDLQPIMKGQVFKQVDTTNWAPGLVDYVTTYAYTGKPLPKGAYKALEQVWIMEGRPMDNLNSWLNSTVVPAMLYGGSGQ